MLYLLKDLIRDIELTKFLNAMHKIIDFNHMRKVEVLVVDANA